MNKVEYNLPSHKQVDSTCFIEERMNNHDVPGVSIAVINNYKIE